ncbi:MAG: DUF1697 domain-containing protein [Thermomicrobiales bacterium]|nr:DUF1697 domain-containing protein [Thermomicrobiales bacterium]
MTTWLALLRAVNVSGRNMVPMADLRVKLTGIGFERVRTYIQSGNILVDSPERDAAVVAMQIQEVILGEYGVTSPAIMVTREELAAAIERNPFLIPDADLKSQRIMFLERHPTAEQIASLDPDRSPGHRYVVEGRVIWLDIPQFHKTRLTNDYFDRKLKTVSTLRNLTTCEALLALMDGA